MPPRWLARVLACAVIVSTFGPMVRAQADRDAIERLEQERAQRVQRSTSTLAPMAPPVQPNRAWLPPLENETPCFPVHRFVWAQVTERIPLAVSSMLQDLPGYVGQCLGAQSLDRLRLNLDARLLEAGYVTSRVYLPEQSLTEGVLTFGLQLGRVGLLKHRTRDGVPIEAPSNWLPVKAGDVLNLRHLEQGAENSTRLPSLSARILIEPGEEPGTSNLVIVHSGAPRWTARVELDNEGLDDFGRGQILFQASVDLGWWGADQLLLWHQRAAAASQGRQQHRSDLSYSVAWGAQLLSVGVGGGGYRRLVRGATVDFAESSRDHSARVELQRVLWRSAGARLSAAVGANRHDAQSFIEDTELLLQRRRSSSLTWGISAQWRRSTWSGSAHWNRQLVRDNDPGIDLMPGPVERPRHDTLGLDYRRSAIGLPLNYMTQVAIRWVRDPAYGPDLPALGGAGTVRGFDGSQQVVGRRSAVWRQDISIDLPAGTSGLQDLAHQLGFGLDVGQVGELEPGVDTSSHQRRLIGMQVALRSQWRRLTSEVALSRALQHPHEWKRPRSRLSFQLAGHF